MSLFSKVPVYCNNCGTTFMTSFQEYDGKVCHKECWLELEQKRTHAIMGKEWKPKGLTGYSGFVAEETTTVNPGKADYIEYVPKIPCAVCGATGWHSFSCTNKGY